MFVALSSTNLWPSIFDIVILSKSIDPIVIKELAGFGYTINCDCGFSFSLMERAFINTTVEAIGLSSVSWPFVIMRTSLPGDIDIGCSVFRNSSIIWVAFVIANCMMPLLVDTVSTLFDTSSILPRTISPSSLSRTPFSHVISTIPCKRTDVDLSTTKHTFLPNVNSLISTSCPDSFIIIPFEYL